MALEVANLVENNNQKYQVIQVVNFFVSKLEVTIHL